jgi:hypothetical protein
MKLLLSLAFAASPPALAADEYTFTSPSGGEFRLHHKTLSKSVQNKQTMISAYWTLTLPDKSVVRSRVDVTGCNDNSGTVTNTIIGHDKVINHIWIGEGVTVYDHVAETQCIFWNAFSAKPK